MRRIALAALTLLALVPAPRGAEERRLRFEGEFVSDDELGISVGPDDGRTLVSVLNPHVPYALVLPYAAYWEFFRERGTLLRAQSDVCNLTLAAWKTNETPEEYLAKKRKLLETSPDGKGIVKMDLVTFQGQRVLRSEVDGARVAKEFEGVRIVHYFAARAVKGVLYELHLSVVLDPTNRDAFVDEQWMNHATVGFNVGDPR